jgi:hypothetical protein
MADYFTRCDQCGGRIFCVTETRDWSGPVGDDGWLVCRLNRRSIEIVHCADCGAPYSSKNFAGLEFL